jgi:hypothetical protein
MSTILQGVRVADRETVDAGLEGRELRMHADRRRGAERIVKFVVHAKEKEFVLDRNAEVTGPPGDAEEYLMSAHMG